MKLFLHRDGDNITSGQVYSVSEMLPGLEKELEKEDKILLHLFIFRIK